MSADKFLICGQKDWSSSTRKVQDTIKSYWLFFYFTSWYSHFTNLPTSWLKLVSCWIICYATMETYHSDAQWIEEDSANPGLYSKYLESVINGGDTEYRWGSTSPTVCLQAPFRILKLLTFPRSFYLSTLRVSIFTKCKTKSGIGIFKYLNSFGHSNISLCVVILYFNENGYSF